jgi:hypothetical protein
VADIEKTLSVAKGKGKLETMDKKLSVLSKKETEQADAAGFERPNASSRASVPELEL